ncbi:hypothetical protein [Parabacteroides timonensis]|uniref:hypothetical protein n=1 Tax=Parabacteroides timonensis TaxID=1871013 RepID=UPI00094F2D2E|nr:hypothetical protein [Parabacteroides timonensis]
MEKTQKKMPVFFSSSLFDFLKIEPYKRATAQSKIEFLRLKKEDIKAILKAKISQEGSFGVIFHYVRFELKFGFLLCVFAPDGECCRAYSFIDISAS